jgi:hypothetical protein
MAARNCLLCGKPLSRIWAGTGEDFCSREHRNQYRLRRGMDRLLEANKVASVMRRRESPKQIPESGLCALGPASPRGFLDPLRVAPAEAVLPFSQPGARPALQSASSYLRPRALAGERGVARELPAAKPFGVQPTRFPGMPIRRDARVAAAPPASLRRKAGAPSERRSTSARWAAPRQPVVACLKLRNEQPPGAPMAGPRVTRGRAAGNRGIALRVSTSAGFLIPERKLPASRANIAGGGFAWPDVKKLTAAAAPAQGSARVTAVESAHGAIRLPSPPKPVLERRFEWPEALEMNVPCRNTANGWRVSAVSFGSADESVAKERK